MKAFLFDLNGTMIHDMDYHTKAWQYIFNHELGGHFSWDEVKPQMYGKNQEVLVRMFGPDRFTEAEMDALARRKEQRYQEEFRPTWRCCPACQSFWNAPTSREFPWLLARRPFRSTLTLCSTICTSGTISRPLSAPTT
ncbi:hypothetical protein MUN79_22470 [Hymenobacter cellulosilyticus]|uniref:HAD family phosphatase n=1 Tax=Hymenobacter cellulosilyticus TaxID=2932248 RepID=A0A8T9QBW1_9BACT|nr:hypothetical protein MUN79_22470 [Hymenobacter cellulosilyticus]